MKKLTVWISMMILCAIQLAGCSATSTTSSFGVVSNGDAGVTITAETAEAKSGGSVDFSVGDNEEVVFDCSALTAGKLQAELKDAGGKVVYTVSVSAKESARFTADPGEYTVDVSVLEKADGKATIKTEPKK